MNEDPSLPTLIVSLILDNTYGVVAFPLDLYPIFKCTLFALIEFALYSVEPRKWF